MVPQLLQDSAGTGTFLKRQGLTCKASLRFWVSAPRASHWSQIRWQRAFTLGES